MWELERIARMMASMWTLASLSQARVQCGHSEECADVSETVGNWDCDAVLAG